MPRAHSWDVVIVGGGPAGLSAALVLGRARRRTLVIDDHKPRNAVAERTHGFFTRDGTTPAELRRLGREQLRPYGVSLVDATAVDARKLDDSFEVTLGSGERHRARRLLLATGLRDTLPDAPGFRELYGKGVHHCPYCDGWEVRDQRLAMYGRSASAAEEALGLRTWSERVALLTDGAPRMPLPLLAQLARNGIEIDTRRLVRLVGRRGRVALAAFEDGSTRPVDAVFFLPHPTQRSDLILRLGLELTRHGTVKTGKLASTSLPGLFAAGDAAYDVQQIAEAVAEGVKAAMAIHKSLRKEDLR